MPMSSKNKCDINIMIRGIGGQGVKLAGSIIGQAALFGGRFAVQGMKYGSAITGGETRSEIKVSTKEIIYPRITDIDAYVALTLDDLENYFESTIYIAASEVAKKIPEPIKNKIIIAPMLAIAEELGDVRSINIVMIGILNQLFNLAPSNAFIKAIKEYLPPKSHQLNIEAYNRGYTLDLTKYNSKKVLDLANLCKIKV